MAFSHRASITTVVEYSPIKAIGLVNNNLSFVRISFEVRQSKGQFKMIQYPGKRNSDIENTQPIVRKQDVVCLTILFLLFTFRVVAQLVQKFYALSFIPQFDKWQSGALPYPVLIAIQLIIILICTKLLVQLARGRTTPKPMVGVIYMGLGGVYFSVMLFRLVGGLTFGSEHHWWSATIPTAFHLVLASFLLLLGRCYYRLRRQDPR